MKIFYDVDTQNDFMNKDGALYVPDAELIKSNLFKLTSYAIEKDIPLVGSVDKHFGTEEYQERESELQINGGPFSAHCMNGTYGQEKISSTKTLTRVLGDIIDKGIYVPHYLTKYASRVELDIDHAIPILTGKHEYTISDIARPSNVGLYFEKQHYDVFTNPGIDLFLKKANVNEAVVYGVATDYCVKAAVLGMQKRNIQCYVVEDAIKGVFPDGAKTALEEMVNAGAKLVTTKQVLEGKI
jgi:nicotinamidase/pyrazinamidase